MCSATTFSNIAHEVVEPLLPGSPAPDPLAVDPQWDCEHANRNEASTQHIEYCKNTTLLQPALDKIREAEGEQIAGVDGDKSFFCETRIAVLKSVSRCCLVVCL